MVFLWQIKEKNVTGHICIMLSLFLFLFSDFGVKYTQLTNLSFFFTIPNFHKKTMNK